MNIEEFNAGADARAEEASADAHIRLEQERLVAEAVADGRKLVTVRTIDAIDDIPGADLIKVATVEGWKVVVKHDEFEVGDLCVFFEVDSYLPLSDERYAFLEKNAIFWHGIKGARLKTIRLRKQLSQGLALPLHDFPEIQAKIQATMDASGMTDLSDGAAWIRELNFTGTIGVMKWEKVMSAQLAGQAKGNFPSFLRKSDQERAQNMSREIFGYEDMLMPFDITNIPAEALAAMQEKGDVVVTNNMMLMGVGGPQWYRVRKAQASRDTRYEVSLKMDGSSMTAYVQLLNEVPFEVKGVCSRNLDLKIESNETNSFIKMAHPDILELIAEQGGDIALQGELMGPGIQGNREGFEYDRFFIYNIFDIKSGEFMTPPERLEWVRNANQVAKQLFGRELLEHVPVLHESVTLAELGITNMDELLKFAEGPSMVHMVREGLVFKAVDGTHQFKVISNKFLEKEE